MNQERIFAAILAGGRSSRFGAPKALAQLRGAPLIAHVARSLSLADEIAVVGDEHAAAAIGARQLIDPTGVARGPLAGVLAGLGWAAERGAAWLAIAPCDTPLLPSDLLVGLRETAGPAALACAETEAGLEPLISIWRVTLYEPLRGRLGGGDHPSAQSLMVELGAARLRLDAVQAMNVNTAADFAQLEAAYAAKPS